MDTINDKYQLSKTLRFGLTLKEKQRKAGFEGEIYQSHAELKDLIDSSEKRIKTSLGNAKKQSQLPIDDIRKCLDNIKQYLQSWEQIHTRYDQIAVLKDFYRRLERKAKFDGFWKDNKSIKQPQSQEIKLSSLKHKYEDKEIKGYIIDYWSTDIKKAKEKLNKVDLVLRKFEIARDEKRDDKKLSEVELRKLFLSLIKLINESLEPLHKRSILFADVEKLSESIKDQQLRDFVFDGKKENLFYEIAELKTYFEENGGYVPYGRVTLNKYTAQQQPNRTNEEINKIITDLKLKEFIKSYNDLTVFEQKFESVKNKEKAFNDQNLSIVEQVQYFKYKTIPIGVQFELSKYLAKDDSEKQKQIEKLLADVGKPKSPAKDYSDLKNKTKFDLYRYPLKVAFDYAWESLAADKHEPVKEFPKKQCSDFLKTIFNVDVVNSKFFNLYADLNYIKINLARIDHNNISKDNLNKYIDNIEKIINPEDFAQKVNYKEEDKNNTEKTTAFSKNKQDIVLWISKLKEIKEDWDVKDYKKIYEQVKKNEEAIFKKYEDAKREIGLSRGGLKHIIETTKTCSDKKTGQLKTVNEKSQYKKLTDIFKCLASEFGKNFATLRDKFNEENEINKISHYGIVVEDNNAYKYLLLSKLSESRKEVENIFLTETEGLKTYTVKSLTSKTLWKFISNTKGISEDFHNKDKAFSFAKKFGKIDDSIDNIISCLQNSKMAKDQNWAEFRWNFEGFKSYEDIEKEVDRKGYILKNDGCLSVETIKDLVERKGCLLLPIVNQDLIREDRTAKNQFTKDWEKIFLSNSGYRLHPEFKIVYRHATPNYPKPEEKRYSHFQMIAHFMYEFIPKTGKYTSKKEQIKIFNDKETQATKVKEFNDTLNLSDDYVIFGIDRGIKQLATLCVLDKNGIIQGGFKIYTRTFDTESKQCKHTLLEKRNILDLSNLRVETTIDGKKVLVDLASIRTKNGENQQKIKLKQLAYIRELQYSMQTRKDKLTEFAKSINSADDITEDKIKSSISPYKEGHHYADLPKKDIYNLLNEWQNANDEEKRKIAELDSAENLKTGIVANMIGVVAFLCERYNYKVCISLEDLTRAFGIQKDALNGIPIDKKDEDFKEQENRRLAGVGTYQFFEMQLLKKLFKTQVDKNLHLVPAFRSVDNYEKIVRRDRKTTGDEYVNFPFGIVRFVDPSYTSQKCPWCEETKKKEFSRQKGVNKNSLFCKTCGVSTITGEEKRSKKYNDKKNLNIEYITDGDQNGAYHIALKAWEILKDKR